MRVLWPEWGQAEGGGEAAAGMAGLGGQWEYRKDPLAPDIIRLSPVFPRVWGWVPLGLGGPVPWGLEWTMVWRQSQGEGMG